MHPAFCGPRAAPWILIIALAIAAAFGIVAVIVESKSAEAANYFGWYALGSASLVAMIGIPSTMTCQECQTRASVSELNYLDSLGQGGCSQVLRDMKVA